MTPIAQRLASLPFLRSVPAEALEASLRYWSLQSHPPGQAYRQRGAAAEELAVVLEGQLEASCDGVALGHVGPGELVGEVAAFLRGGRASATLTPTQPTTLLALRVQGLLGLRRARSPLYDALLAQALDTLCRRVRETDARFERLAERLPPYGGAAEAPTNPGRSPTPPPLAPLLARLPGARALDPDTRAALERAFTPEPLHVGQRLIEQDAAGERAYLLAEGRVRVFREAAGQDATLTLLGPGDPFGVNALVDGGTRTACCEALTDGWVFTLSAAALHALPAPARRELNEVLLATLAAELRVANALVNEPALSEAEAQLFRAMLAVSGAPDETTPVEPAAAQDPLRPPLAEG